MNAKLNLSLNKTVIEAIKSYAEQRDISVSSIVERYFIDLLYVKEMKYPPHIEEMIGSLKVEEPITDYKEAKMKYLKEKYLQD